LAVPECPGALTADPKVHCPGFLHPGLCEAKFRDEERNSGVSCIQIKKIHFALEIATFGSYLTISAGNTPPKLSALISQRGPEHMETLGNSFLFEHLGKSLS
jgi:hypothetical protein